MGKACTFEQKVKLYINVNKILIVGLNVMQTFCGPLYAKLFQCNYGLQCTPKMGMY